MFDKRKFLRMLQEFEFPPHFKKRWQRLDMYVAWINGENDILYWSCILRCCLSKLAWFIWQSWLAMIKP